MRRITRIDQPEFTLSKLEQLSLINELLPVARSGFGSQMTVEDVQDHLFNVDFLYLLEDNDRTVGFSGYRRFREPEGKMLFLHGIVLERSMQTKGFFRAANEQAILEEKPDYLLMRTQNPVIYEATRKLVQTIYPNEERTPGSIEAIARRFSTKPLEDDVLVSRGYYGACLYDAIPHPGEARAFFDGKLAMNYTRGDSVFLVGACK